MRGRTQTGKGTKDGAIGDGTIGNGNHGNRGIQEATGRGMIPDAMTPDAAWLIYLVAPPLSQTLS